MGEEESGSAYDLLNLPSSIGRGEGLEIDGTSLYDPAAIHRKFIEIDKGRPIRKKPKSNSAYELRAARDL